MPYTKQNQDPMQMYVGMPLNERFYDSFEEFEEESQERDAIIAKEGTNATEGLTAAYDSDETPLRRAIYRSFGETNSDIQPDGLEVETFFAFLLAGIGTSAVYRRNANRVGISAKEAAHQILVIGADRYNIPIGRGETVSFDILDEVIDRRIREGARYYTEGTRNAIKRAFNNVLDGGVTNVDDMAREMIRRYKSKRYIAETVARTAVGDVVGMTDMYMYTAAPNVQYVRWLSRFDSRVRQGHRINASVNGGLIEPGGRWPDGSTHCPSGYNCRCRGEGISAEDVRRRQNGELYLNGRVYQGPPSQPLSGFPKS